MKKLILFVILFFGIMPVLKQGKLSLSNVTSAYADDYGDEDGDGGDDGSGYDFDDPGDYPDEPVTQMSAGDMFDYKELCTSEGCIVESSMFFDGDPRYPTLVTITAPDGAVAIWQETDPITNRDNGLQTSWQEISYTPPPGEIPETPEQGGDEGGSELSWSEPLYDGSNGSFPSPDIPPDDNNLYYALIDNGIIYPSQPSTADLIKIQNIILNYDSFLGLWEREGKFINAQVSSTGSNFGYGAFWRLAQNIPTNSYTGAIGITGEGISAYEQYSALNNVGATGTSILNPNSSTTYTPHEIGEQGTWDYKLSFAALTDGVFQLGDEQTVNGTSFPISKQMQSAHVIDFYFEVKTISPNSDVNSLTTYITKGFNQAIMNAQVNPSSGTNTTASVLIVDYDAYMKAYNANPNSFTALYNQLANLGGFLHLTKGLFTDTKTAVDAINKAIKDQTSKQP